MARYLNIKYKTLPNVVVIVTGIAQLSGVQDAIRATLPNALALDITGAYYKEMNKGGLALTVQIVPPKASRSFSAFAGTDSTMPASKRRCIRASLVPDTTAGHVRDFFSEAADDSRPFGFAEIPDLLLPTTSPIAEVNVTGVTRMGGVQDAIKAKFADTLPLAAAQIQLHDVHNNRITDFDAIHDHYFEKIKDGGLALTIQPIPVDQIPRKTPNRPTLMSGGSQPGISTIPTPEASILSVRTAPAFTQQDIDGELVPEITADLKAF
ncbi:hypothetical protein CcCBS67573_g07448 [Chytriomyces confervae]|uniref:Uncharacterized protein n=1 Tax=Chytriomyces confervae TaxID=246404 RepID=A0A507EW89_9FUNG|nr:hypothetical protein CcCBS67573_g07448 [Chytriomyces confervae]